LIFRRDLLPPWREASLPAFPGWAAALGPGVVWMALAQGSGELVWWPYVIAKYGLGFLFLLLPACLLQWPVTYEIGRYTVLTGESVWQGFIRLHPWFAFPLWVLMTVSFAWFGAFASAGGTALAALTRFPAGWSVQGQSLFWGYAAMAVFVGALVVSPVLYRFIERFMLLSAVVTFVGLLGACTHPAVLERLPAFLGGLVSPERPLPRPWDPADAKPLLTALTFAGLGGFWTLFYSYWLKEKGAGMARHGGHITGVTRRDEGEAVEAGFRPSDEPEAAGRLRRWKAFLIADSGVGIFGNIATTLMTCLLAYAVLLPQGLLPQGWDLAVVQSEFFALRWGAVGRALFLVVAAAFLADTWVTTADAVSRVNTDIVHSFFPSARKKSPRWWYFFFLGAGTVVTGVTMPLAQPGPLILISAVTGFMGTVAFCIALVALNHFHLPPRLPAFARPGRASLVLISASCLAYLALAAAYLWMEFK
jgi:Mn2+/Fe2+ NRAMP family transporter